MGYVGVSVDLTGAKRAEAELRRSREETIHRLSRAVEMRDMDTGGHIVRIAEYAAEIARRLGLEQRPGRADPRGEPDARRRQARDLRPHPPQARRARLRRAARDEAPHHDRLRDPLRHRAPTCSRWPRRSRSPTTSGSTGRGYPRELAGELIPLEGRIVAVADVYDALTSDRVYRKAFSHEDAVEMMRAERGTHFDPEALDAMLDLLDAADN